MLLNVNMPGVAAESVQGITVTRLGKRHYAEPVIQARNPRGETVYWIGPAGSAKEAGPGTDFHAVAQRWVSRDAARRRPDRRSLDRPGQGLARRLTA